MKSWAKVLCLIVAVTLCVSAGYGWGSATHVYFAKQLGTRLGVMNLNEMYGAVLPDFLGTKFDDLTKMGVDIALHTDKELMYALYGSPQSMTSRAVFYGLFTHNNNEVLKGADWYAHGPYPDPGNKPGWVIQQGVKLVQDPTIYAYIVSLVGPEFAPYVAPALGHTLVEGGVDILVRRNQDPLVGARLLLAARSRSDEAAAVLSAVLTSAAGNDLGFASDEAAYRESMIQYGQLFLLPERQVIQALAGETATLAEAYVAAMSEGQLVIDVDPAMIEKFMRQAIRQVEPIYRNEIVATLRAVERNMKSYNLIPSYPVIALGAGGDTEKEIQEIALTSGLMPTSFALDQNFPNPFNPSTTISYALPNDVPVTVKVYNSIGQEVATLIEALQPAGMHQVVWDAKSFPSGVYIYRLTAGSYVETRKMMLMK